MWTNCGAGDSYEQRRVTNWCLSVQERAVVCVIVLGILYSLAVAYTMKRIIYFVRYFFLKSGSTVWAVESSRLHYKTRSYTHISKHYVSRHSLGESLALKLIFIQIKLPESSHLYVLNFKVNVSSKLFWQEPNAILAILMSLCDLSLGMVWRNHATALQFTPQKTTPLSACQSESQVCR